MQCTTPSVISITLGDAIATLNVIKLLSVIIITLRVEVVDVKKKLLTVLTPCVIKTSDTLAVVLETPQLVIEAEVVEPENRTEDQAGLVLVRVPAGNYGGFSGGPAARVDAAGRLQVFGTIVHQSYVMIGKSVDYVLGIARLPKNINEPWIWKSY